mmetsp:Transcript_24252/g.37383  ORF Transcript_24252/g.37383 Transcript_24252/m.37383 type:complete len:110 (+) Transcript_24252:28-357(+)
MEFIKSMKKPKEAEKVVIRSIVEVIERKKRLRARQESTSRANDKIAKDCVCTFVTWNKGDYVIIKLEKEASANVRRFSTITSAPVVDAAEDRVGMTRKVAIPIFSPLTH